MRYVCRYLISWVCRHVGVHLCMCVCMSVCMCVYIYISLSIFLSLYVGILPAVSVSLYVRTYACMHYGFVRLCHVIRCNALPCRQKCRNADALPGWMQSLRQRCRNERCRRGDRLPYVPPLPDRINCGAGQHRCGHTSWAQHGPATDLCVLAFNHLV